MSLTDISIRVNVSQCENLCSVNNKMNRRKRAYNWNHHTDDFVNGVGGDRSSCRARYQQSSVDVFAKFVAIDQVKLTEVFKFLSNRLSLSTGFRSRELSHFAPNRPACYRSGSASLAGRRSQNRHSSGQNASGSRDGPN